MRIVVTGIGGHVGGAAARRFLELGHEVVGIGRTPTTTLEGILYCRLDIAEAEFPTEALRRIDACDAFIHAAACLSETPDDTDISRINCLGTQQAIAAASLLQARRFIFFSSLSVLRRPIQTPITEEHPIEPTSAYAASKYYGERLAALASGTAMRTASLRISSPIGPGLKRRRIFRVFVEQALRSAPIAINGSGGRRQDYVDARDIARAAEGLLDSDAEGIFNIGSGRTTSNLELAQRCTTLLHSSADIAFSGTPDPEEGVRWEIDIEKARRVFGYRPAYSLDASILDLAAELR